MVQYQARAGSDAHGAAEAWRCRRPRLPLDTARQWTTMCLSSHRAALPLVIGLADPAQHTHSAGPPFVPVRASCIGVHDVKHLGGRTQAARSRGRSVNVRIAVGHVCRREGALHAGVRECVRDATSIGVCNGRRAAHVSGAPGHRAACSSPACSCHANSTGAWSRCGQGAQSCKLVAGDGTVLLGLVTSLRARGARL